MRKKPVSPENPLFDDFFDPVDAEPFAPDPLRKAVDSELLKVVRMLEQRFESILLLLVREYERVLREGGVRRRAEIVRRSVACGCFADAPLDRKARRELAALEQDFAKVFSPEQMALFSEFREKLMAQYDWSMDYTQRFCAALSRKKLREWITVVYDE